MAAKHKHKHDETPITGLPEWPEGSHRIVVGVDGSDSSLAALGWAARQAELTGAALQVVTSWEWPTAVGWAAAPVPGDYQPADDAQRLLDQVVAPVRTAHPAIGIHTTVVEGHPAPVLVEASRGADLLVVGSRGRGQFAGMLLGSVSEHCTASAHCPVLVLHETA
jgi:nucleotide-binding universal stress UspA family protein